MGLGKTEMAGIGIQSFMSPGTIFPSLQGIAADKQAQAQENFMKEQAQAREDAAEREEERVRRRNRRELASQENAFRGSGIAFEGSPLDALALNAAEFEREAIAIRHTGRVEAGTLRTGAKRLRAAGRIGAATATHSSLLGAGGRAASVTGLFA